MTPSAALDLVPPVYEWMPEYGRTLGPEAGELAALAGFPPDPEQQMALDWLFALNHGKSAVRDFGLCAPRQNLKTGFLKQTALGWLFITEQRLVVWSAHEFSTSQEAFRDMCQLIEDCPDLDREVKQIHRGNGEEAIELLGDRRLKFRARTKSGGRGLSGDKVVLDEAMYLKPAHIGALIPTLRARPDPQVVLAGSGGMLDSDVWRSYRDRGRAGGDPTLAWLEWSDPDPRCEQDDCPHTYGLVTGCALDDRARWRRLNTALGRRITEETLASDRRGFPADEFARETLGWWEDPLSEGGAFDPLLWAGYADPDAPRGNAPLFALDIAPDQSTANVAVAWPRPDGRGQVMIAHHQRGVDGLEDEVNRLCRDWSAEVIVEKAGTAAFLISKLDRVREVARQHYTDACGHLDAEFAAGDVRHGNQPVLNEAVRVAAWRVSGVGRSLDRRDPRISPLVAAAHALYGTSTARPSVYEERGFLSL